MAFLEEYRAFKFKKPTKHEMIKINQEPFI